MVVDMVEYYDLIQRLGLNIIYSGPVWPGSMEGIAETLRKRMIYDELGLSASQSIFSVFVEQMNNVLMYSSEKEEVLSQDKNDIDVSRGIFFLGSKEGKYFLQSGNIIKEDSAALIKERIDYVNTLDKKELRQFYKEQIKKENLNPESKGAGIGLIEIARRASSKIEYSFTPRGEGMMFYAMCVTIG